jgi:3-hydroxyacyl-[acyl-carrier-protein] dehydratase
MRALDEDETASLLRPGDTPSAIYFIAIDKARLRRAVRPGDVIHYRVEKIRSRRLMWRYRGQAVVDGIVVARAEFSAAIVDTAHQDDQPNRTDQAAS